MEQQSAHNEPYLSSPYYRVPVGRHGLTLPYSIAYGIMRSGVIASEVEQAGIETPIVAYLTELPAAGR